MENGFTTFWRETREEGRQEGEANGELKATLNNIATVQRKNNMSFDEAADFLDISEETREKIRNGLMPL